MRERLIELIKRDNCRNPFTCSPQCKYVESDDCHSERLADLILADGWMRPPCKVGDIIYRIVNGKIKESEVEKIEITKNLPAIFTIGTEWDTSCQLFLISAKQYSSPKKKQKRS